MGSKSQEIIGLHGIESLSTLLGARPAAALGHFLQGFADEFGAALLEVGSAQGAIAIRDWLVAHTACRQEALLDLAAVTRWAGASASLEGAPVVVASAFDAEPEQWPGLFAGIEAHLGDLESNLQGPFVLLVPPACARVLHQEAPTLAEALELRLQVDPQVSPRIGLLAPPSAPVVSAPKLYSLDELTESVLGMVELDEAPPPEPAPTPEVLGRLKLIRSTAAFPAIKIQEVHRGLSDARTQGALRSEPSSEAPPPVPPALVMSGPPPQVAPPRVPMPPPPPMAPPPPPPMARAHPGPPPALQPSTGAPPRVAPPMPAPRSGPAPARTPAVAPPRVDGTVEAPPRVERRRRVAMSTPPAPSSPAHELLTLARHRLAAGDLRGAEDAISEAEELDDSVPIRLLALRGLARVRMAQGEWVRALTSLRKAAGLLGEDEHRERGVLAGEEAHLHLRMGDEQKAIDLYHQKIKLMAACGEQRHMARALGRLARIYMGRDALPEAVTLLDREVRLYRQMGDAEAFVRTASELARVYLRAGELDNALRVQRLVLKARERLEGLSGRVLGMSDFAKRLLEYGHREVGAALSREAAKLFHHVEAPHEQMVALLDLAAVELSEGKPNAAFARLQEAYGIARDLGDTNGRAHIAARLGQALAVTGRFDEAEQLLNKARSEFEALEQPAAADQVRELLRQVRARRG